MSLEANTRPQNGEAWDALLTTGEAAEELGVSAAQLRIFVRTGQIVRIGPGSDGSYRYERTDVERLGEAVEAAKAQKAAGVRSSTPDAAVAAAAVKLVQQTQAHLEAIIRTSQAPTHQSLELLTGIMRSQAERITALEAERMAYLTQYERMLSLDHERSMSVRAHQASQKRKDRAFELLMKRAPTLLDQLQTTLGGRSEKVSAAIDLLTTLEPVQLQALLASGFLSDAQAASVRRIVPELAETQPSKEETE